MNTIFLFLFFLYGCSSQDPLNHSQWQQIEGRDEEAISQTIKRHPVYRAKIPLDWKRVDPDPKTSIYDTTKAICEFAIEEEDKKIRITVHNFPSDKIEQRIPAIAHIHRWKEQFDSIDPTSITIIPQAHGGFAGLLLECQGIMQGKETHIFAWSMQLAQELYLALQLYGSAEEMRYFTQMQADYTIKVIGEKYLMEKYQPDIFAFARSFELIYDIPND